MAGADYTAKTGSLSFLPGGALQQTVTVSTLDDATFEADAETFNLTATNATNAQSSTALGTIVDNEPHPTVIAISDLTLNEGSTGKIPAVLTVTLDKASTAPITVRYTTVAGASLATADYTPKINKQLVFEAGVTSKTVSIPLVSDVVAEPNESFMVVLHDQFGAALGKAVGIVNVLNDDVPAATAKVSVADYQRDRR